MALHEFRHVEADHCLFAAEEIRGQSFGQLGLTDTGGAGENEAGDRAIGILEPDACTPDGLGNSFDSLILTNQTGVKGVLHVEQFHGLAFREFLHRNTCPGGNDLGDVLLVDHRGGFSGCISSRCFGHSRSGIALRNGCGLSRG
ncbi:MAG: Uncharacterised protein [Synechococcus sp. CC9902]|nr:MAG: Uncharacterised protein [Synechococcus sp. CC9902]